MPIQNVPVIAAPYPSIDGIETFDMVSVNIHDGYISSANFLTRRPGLELYTTMPVSNNIDGLFYWEEENLLITITNGNCYKTDSSKTTTLLASNVGFGSRASFAVSKIAGNDYLVFCNGGSLYYSIDGASAIQITDPDAPTQATHCIFVGGRVVANDTNAANKGKFFFSEINDVTNWSALSFVSAGGSPDDIVAIQKYWDEVVLVGTRSIERYYLTDNATAPFRVRQATQQDIGTRSQNSIAYDDNEQVFFFLTNKKDVVIYNLNQIQKISAPIDSLLKSYSDVSDFQGFILNHSDKRFYILSSIINNITFVYDAYKQCWYRWSYWNKLLNRYDAFLGNVCTYSPTLGFLIGSRKTDGKIYQVKADVYQDDSSTIRTSIQTGWTNMNTHLNKTFKKIIIRSKTTPGTDVYFTMNWRLNREDGFITNTPKTINIGSSSIKPFTQTLFNFGSGRAIQFEIVCTDNIPFVFGSMEIDYSVNRS